MPHETLLDNQGWFKKLARRFGPGHVVNTCFLIVMLFSTLLTAGSDDTERRVCRQSAQSSGERRECP